MNLILKRSSKRKTISVAVYPDQRVVVSAPTRLPEEKILKFINEKQGWIDSKLKWMASLITTTEKRNFETPALKRATEKTLRLKALNQLNDRVNHYANLLGVKPKNISIRNYRSRWGTCKSNGDLTFNWRLIFASELVFDYVVVHELSHLKEFNHSPAFWRTVESVFPEFREAKKELKMKSFAGELDF